MGAADGGSFLELMTPIFRAVHGGLTGAGAKVDLHADPCMPRGRLTAMTVVTDHPRCRVLLVEDDAPIREMTKDILNEDGFDVLDVGDAETALGCLKQGPFDLLVSDVGLPGMDGRDLATLATTLHPAMPILLVTGYAGQAGARPDFLACGIKLLRKPFTLRQLLSTVRALV